MKKLVVYIFLIVLFLFPQIAFAQHTATQIQILDFGILCHINKQMRATVIVATDGSYSGSGSGPTVITKANPQKGIVQYAVTGNAQITPVRTATTSLSCINCAEPCSNSISLTSLSVNPQSKQHLKNSSVDFSYGGTLIIESGGCPSGVYEGVLPLTFTSNSGTPATCNLTVRATLVDDLSSIVISNDQNLSFGTILVDGAYSVTVSTAGARTSTNASALAAGGTVQQGIFSLNNTTGAAKSVTSVTLDSNITLSNGTSNISATLTSSPAVSSITSVSAGRTYINVGGTLQMTGSESGGTYNGNYTLTVNY